MQPNDYQLSGGAKGQYYDISAETERENGDYYNGINLMAESPRYKNYFLRGQWYCKEARSINEQTLSAIKDIEPFYLGTTISLQEWEKPAILTLFALRFKHSEIEWQTNFLGSSIFSMKLGKKYPIRNKWFYEPLIIYERRNSKEFFQYKLTMGVNF